MNAMGDDACVICSIITHSVCRLHYDFSKKCRKKNYKRQILCIEMGQGKTLESNNRKY